MMSKLNQFSVILPSWIEKQVDFDAIYSSDSQKLQLAINLSRWNVDNETGGPFGAAVFDDGSDRLIAVGVNRAVPEMCSTAHAEIMAVSLAQKRLHRYRLDLTKDRKFVLASSAQPCAMCFGALLWSGISRLIYGADRDQVMRISGFDEGPLPENWQAECEKCKIRVEKPFLQEEACEVLKRYNLKDGIIY
jgi:tRNA(Arg) A34 adenosine deaminase TadA